MDSCCACIAASLIVRAGLMLHMDKGHALAPCFGPGIASAERAMLHCCFPFERITGLPVHISQRAMADWHAQNMPYSSALIDVVGRHALVGKRILLVQYLHSWYQVVSGV